MRASYKRNLCLDSRQFVCIEKKYQQLIKQDKLDDLKKKKNDKNCNQLNCIRIYMIVIINRNDQQLFYFIVIITNLFYTPY